MKSAVLAVGTELTDGQIVNSNAAWLAERLKPLGPRCVLHLTVADDRPAISRALDLCAEQADLIFVTGGLGPTSDDFTRDVIADWAGEKLEYHEPSWVAIEERFRARNYPTTPIQKQQCYFPRGSTVLTNAQGTANGFRLRAKNREIIVLPGPPRELAAIWTDHLRAWVSDLARDLDPVVTRSWDTIGLGESQVADLIVPLLNDSVEAGYRVHLPYVEFKASFARSHLEKVIPLLSKIETALAPYTVARDGTDIANELAEKLCHEPRVTIVDQVSGHVLLARLQKPLQAVFAEKKWIVTSEDAKAEGLTLWLKPVDSHEVRVGLKRDGQTTETRITSTSTMKAAVMSERRKQYFAELALVHWARWMDSI